MIPYLILFEKFDENVLKKTFRINFSSHWRYLKYPDMSYNLFYQGAILGNALVLGEYSFCIVNQYHFEVVFVLVLAQNFV